MNGRGTALALALVVGAVPAFADNARPRSGGSSGGGSSAGARHHSGGSGSSSSGYKANRGSSSSAGARHAPSGAELRHPRAGTGRGRRPYYGGYYGHGYPYYGYRPYYYGYGPYWDYGFGYYPYYYGGLYSYGYAPRYDYGYRNDSAAVRTFVEPSETKVYVDGQYAGTADDFDGMFQRLYVSPGGHEIALGLEGYKTHRIKVYVAPGHTLKLHYDMVKGSGEDAQIDTLGNPEDERFGKRDRRFDGDEDDDRDRYRDEVRRDDGRRDRDENAADEDGGTVRLAIRPGDASIYVDGQFRGAADRLTSMSLRPGRHRIEVVRPGFRTIERDVDVRGGEETTLELELSQS